MERRKTGLVCNTCGSTGFAEFLAICETCKVICAHLYCMKKIAKRNYGYKCEECIDNEKILNDQKGKSPLIEIGSPTKRNGVKIEEKKCIPLPPVGKVKFIPQGEITFSNAQKFAKKSVIEKNKSKSQKIRHMTDILSDKTKDKVTGKVVAKKTELTEFRNPNPRSGMLNNNLPIPTVIWKGRIEYFELVVHSHNVDAHLGQNASQKVLETSRKMGPTKNVNLKIKSLKQVWPKAFKLEPPCKEDIGFYFFSSETSLLKEKFTRLVKRLYKNEQVLICRVDSLNLLIFSSQILPKDIQWIRGEPYLWGILVHKKKKKRAQMNVDSRHDNSNSRKDREKKVHFNSNASGSQPSRGRFRL